MGRTIRTLVAALGCFAAAPAEHTIVFTQLRPGNAPRAQAGGLLRGPWGEGARIVLRTPDGGTRVLTADFHSAADPEVSFDATHILFAGKRTASENWNIYEMSADGSSVRQITRGLGDCRSPVYQSEIFYLDDPGPLPQIAFVSTAAGELNERAPVSATNLYSSKLDGSDVRRLTYNPSSSFDPFLVPDGRIVFSTWYGAGRIDLLGVNKDGTDYAAFSGPQGLGIKHMGCVTPKRQVVFVEAAAAAWDGAGSLAAISLRRNLHSYRSLASGLFHSPSPLPDGRLLVSRRPAAGSGTHGIFRFDPETGAITPVFDDPRLHDIQAKIVAQREAPDGRSSVVDEKVPTAKLYCLNVYDSDLNLPRGSVKRLRVIEGVPAHQRSAKGELLRQRLLGEIDVEDDGSFHIQVPANIPIRLQTLDARGMALRTSAWIWAKNKENRGCIGCHEDGERSPENVMAKALTKPAIELTLAPERRRIVDYARDIAPILKQKCAAGACHGGSIAGFRKYVVPGQARRSPLASRRMPPPGSPQLTDDERRAIIEWIDLEEPKTAPSGAVGKSLGQAKPPAPPPQPVDLQVGAGSSACAFSSRSPFRAGAGTETRASARGLAKERP